ncbi:MAG: hypothetical protein LBC85_03435 [Fibromonadaceae bacterium]|nr:hypothetical protein [Fibromonadaceae bacterium]
MQRTYYTIGRKTCYDSGMSWLQSEIMPAYDDDGFAEHRQGCLGQALMV